MHAKSGRKILFVATKKQALRDVTANATLDAASTAAEVRAVWDTSVLGDRPADHT